MAYDLDAYDTVDSRIHSWYGTYPDGRITTRLEHHRFDEHGLADVVVSAAVYRHDGDTEPAGTGLAHEHRTERGMLAASTLEVCETSAIGRALASAGYSTKGLRPSREEMVAARAASQTTGGDVSPDLPAGPPALSRADEAGGDAPPQPASPPAPSMGEAIGNVIDAMPGTRIESQEDTPAVKGGRGRPTPATDKQKGMIRRVCAKLNLEGDLAREYVAHVLGEPVAFDALTKMQASDLITALLEDEAKQADPANNPAITEDPWAQDAGF